MKMSERISYPSLYNAVEGNNFSADFVRWINETVAILAEYIVSGRDNTGVGATFQKQIPGFQFPTMTTATRDSVGSWNEGVVIYNTTLSKLQVYSGGAWVNLH